MESEFYLQARRAWDERYGDRVRGERNWQITSAGLMHLSLILALSIVRMNARTKVIPFVVEVDKLGYAITIPTALTDAAMPATVERMKRYRSRAKGVIDDPCARIDKNSVWSGRPGSNRRRPAWEGRRRGRAGEARG
jgi:type IV secretion system protein TrbF